MGERQKGAALIIVLMLVATMAVMAVALTETMRDLTRQSRAVTFRDNAIWVLMGAEQAAIALLTQQATGREKVDTPDEFWLAGPIRVPIDGGLLTVTFSDQSACFNVNHLASGSDGRAARADTAAIGRFGRLTEGLGADRRSGEFLAAAIADFIDADAQAEPGGAEDYAYNVGSHPYLTAGGPVADISEVRAIAGWTAPMFRALHDFLCIRDDSHGFGLLNVNTLTIDDAPVLFSALDGRVPMGSLEQLLERPPNDGYEDVAAFLGQATFSSLDPPLGPEISGRFATYASLIELRAIVAFEGERFEVTSTIESTGGNDYRVVRRRFGTSDL